jgi:hypothetical protein
MRIDTVTDSPQLVRQLSQLEIDDLRREMIASSAWMKGELSRRKNGEVGQAPSSVGQVVNERSHAPLE